ALFQPLKGGFARPEGEMRDEGGQACLFFEELRADRGDGCKPVVGKGQGGAVPDAPIEILDEVRLGYLPDGSFRAENLHIRHRIALVVAATTSLQPRSSALATRPVIRTALPKRPPMPLSTSTMTPRSSVRMLWPG